MQWLTKLPLYVLFFECLSYFPQGLRPVVIGAPLVHSVLFLLAGFLQIFSIGAQSANLVFTIVTDLALLSFSVLLLLHPTIRGIATPRQANIAWFLIAVGVFSLVAGIIRFAVTRLPANTTVHSLNIALDCRNILWMAIETLTAVVCCHTPTFRRLLAPEKKHANHHDEADEEKDIQLQVSPRVARPRSDESAWV
ncbi:hypothetical protein EDC01DRAFT_782913 [Geopyxis carbonaria]|nr:hypothetical protein EDC01DRAFT_782913 [Geopyxis carbonaria]